MVVACKDARIRRNPLERRALYHSTLRVFCLTNGHLDGEEQGQRFARNMERIRRVLRTQSGRPWVYAVHESRLERLRIYPPPQ
jgi:hypothetical protein